MEQNEYRLGDIICGFMNSHFAPNNSIGKEYKNSTNQINDYKTLNQIIKERSKNMINKPGDNDLVIHIRLGDVIENSCYTVNDYWTSVENLNNIGPDISPHIIYIKNKYYYKNLELNIKNLNIKNIILVTFFHRSKTFNKSIEYLENIKNIFKEYNIIERINKDIDEDFIFCSLSKYFIGSGGGFSHVIGNLVELNGNFVLNNDLIHTHPGIYLGMWINNNSLKYYTNNDDKSYLLDCINNINMRGIWIPQINNNTVMPKLNFYEIEWSKETNVFYYDINKYNFYSLINKLYNKELNNTFNLCKIHNYFDEEINRYYNNKLLFGQNDRESKLISIFYNYFDNNEEFNILYKKFIKEFILKLFPDEKLIIYQKTPNIRFHIPNKSNIGKLDSDPDNNIIGLHCDNQVGHYENELNIILPLTLMFDSNTIQFEKKPNSKISYDQYESLTLISNCISINYFNKCMHYNKINKTNNTRVSFDFRIIPGSLYNEDNINSSITYNKKFLVGEYFDIIEL